MSPVNTYISISLAQYNHFFNHNGMQREHRKLPQAVMFAARAHLALFGFCVAGCSHHAALSQVVSAVSTPLDPNFLNCECDDFKFHYTTEKTDHLTLDLAFNYLKKKSKCI